jgi:hypothetical protein
MQVKFNTKKYKSFANVTPTDLVNYLKEEEIFTETCETKKTKCILLANARYTDKSYELSITGDQDEMESFYILWDLTDEISWSMKSAIQAGSKVKSLKTGSEG